ncbi:glycosyltransferase family 4 protein [Jatrophihabitans sp. YIM 134969]
MRIGMVCPYSFEVPGGVQWHVRDLAEYLIGHGHEVSVLAPADDDTPLPPYVVSSGRAVQIPYNGSVARVNFGPRAMARVSRWVESGSFDLLHLHEPITPSISLLALWAAETPVVATFHTASVRSRAMQSARPVIGASLDKIVGRIAVSAEAQRTLREGMHADAVVIPNAVYTSAFADAEPEPAWCGTPDRPTIGFLGRIDESRKGLAVVLAALPTVLARFPGARLLVVGPGDQAEAVEGVPEDVRRHVEFLGAVSDEEKHRFYRSIDAFVAPHTGGESFGMVLVEAMSAGVPVVASDIPPFADVLGPDLSHLSFPVQDAPALAGRVLQLLADPELRADAAATGRRVAAQYDWSTVAARIVEVYELARLSWASMAEAFEAEPARTARLPGERRRDRAVSWIRRGEL